MPSVMTALQGPQSPSQHIFTWCGLQCLTSHHPILPEFAPRSGAGTRPASGNHMEWAYPCSCFSPAEEGGVERGSYLVMLGSYLFLALCSRIPPEVQETIWVAGDGTWDSHMHSHMTPCCPVSDPP